MAILNFKLLADFGDEMPTTLGVVLLLFFKQHLFSSLRGIFTIVLCYMVWH